MIETTSELTDLAARIAKAPWVALDTEADSLHAYPQKLCLLQVAIPGEASLIDPLADLHLEPLFEALDRHQVIFHAADYDLRLLFQGHHFRPPSIFDTMWAARLLGESRFGLNDLLTKFLGITLEKGSQKANWGKRPLTPKMTQYALNDVLHLYELSSILRTQLEAKGRLDWHRQICERSVADASQPERIDPDQVWRIKGYDKLDSLGLTILRSLWHWREREALRTGKPPFFVAHHETLSDLAAHVASDAVSTIRWPLYLTARRRKEMTAAIQEALAVSEESRPRPQSQRARRMTQSELDEAERMRIRRDQRAKELELDPTIVASKATLFGLARKDPEEWERLLPWQKQILLSAT